MVRLIALGCTRGRDRSGNPFALQRKRLERIARPAAQIIQLIDGMMEVEYQFRS